MIRLRDDDVLMKRKEFRGREFARFQQFHEIICQDPKHFIHIGAILTREIQEFPDCIKYLRAETEAGRFFPEVHGLYHVDYALLYPNEIKDHLIQSRKFIEDSFGYSPTIWYTPWGAGADERGSHLNQAAIDAGFEMVTTKGITYIDSVLADIDSESIDVVLTKWDGSELFHHWWERRAKGNEGLSDLQLLIEWSSKLP